MPQTSAGRTIDTCLAVGARSTSAEASATPPAYPSSTISITLDVSILDCSTTPLVAAQGAPVLVVAIRGTSVLVVTPLG